MDILPPTAGVSSFCGESEFYEECYEYKLANAQPELVYVSAQFTSFVQPNLR